MDIMQERNIRVLKYLTNDGDYMYRQNPDAPVNAPWNSVADPYTQCGCHPEVVSRLWDGIGAALPEDCRRLVWSNPCLVHPENQVIFGIALGTWYGLRLPWTLASEAMRSGAETRMKFSDGVDMDIQKVLGEEWVFGAFLPGEIGWSKCAFQVYSLPSDVVAKVERDFPTNEVVSIIGMITDLRREAPDIFGDRVTRCVILVAKGSFDNFVKAVKLARLDWRDLIVQAEYDGWSGEENRRRDLNMPFEN